MNVLLIGGSSGLTNRLIRKLKKENHRIYLLTGSKYNSQSYEKVFERYDFSYDSQCISDIFESVNPDVTIFMGAFDSTFRWHEEQQEVVQFVAGLTNLLTAYSMRGKGRFIYLSSDEVFDGNYDEDITEDTRTSPSTFRGIALAQGEELCQNFRTGREKDIVVLRLSHIYRVPATLQDADSLCAGMCIQAMRTGKISVNSGRILSILYEADAVEMVYRLIASEEHQYSLYHIASPTVLTEKDIAEIIAQAMEKPARIEEQEGSWRCVLSCRRFDSEFGISVRTDTDKTLVRMTEYMSTHPEIFLAEEQPKTGFWKRLLAKGGGILRALIPYIETLICFIPFFMLNNRAVGSAYFSNLDFYLLYVLLFAIVHGQHQATFAAVLSVMGYCFRQMYTRSRFEVLLDLNTYVWIAQLFILGLVVGYMRDQIQKLKLEAEEHQQYLNRQLSDLKDINGSNVRVKDALEMEIVNQSDSIGKIYRMTSRIDQNMPEEVLFNAVEVLSDLLGTKDVAIYIVQGDLYARLFAHTSLKAASLGKSIRYRELTDVYEALSNRRVYINKELNERYPLMASAIYEKDQIQLMIMVWGLPWERMTLGQADMMVMISALIQNSALRAFRYINMLEDQRYEKGEPVLNREAFISLVRVFIQARNKGLTECAMLHLTGLNEGNRKTLEESLIHALRRSDYVGTLGDGEVYALLTNTDREGAAHVTGRLREIGCECALAEDLSL